MQRGSGFVGMIDRLIRSMHLHARRQLPPSSSDSASVYPGCRRADGHELHDLKRLEHPGDQGIAWMLDGQRHFKGTS